MTWIASWLWCRICGEHHVAAYPADIYDEDAQECPNCGHMACEPDEKRNIETGLAE